MPDTLSLLIGGRKEPCASGRAYQVTNPADNTTLALAPNAEAPDVERAVAAARHAFDAGPWPRTPPRERQRVLQRLAELIRREAEELARTESRNCGKPLRESRLDVANAAATFEYYASLAPQALGQVLPLTDQLFDFAVREPLGVCGLIVPWNFPLLIAAWKAAPALACGNTVVLKPSEFTPLTALRLGELALEAGLPPGALNVVTGFGPGAGAPLVTSPDVDMVSFTGGTATGRAIMRLASDTVKKLALELGGKSPNIVFPDCDWNDALEGSLFAIFTNAGQRCTARSRLLLHRSIAERFLADFVARARQIRLGDPLDPATEMGPLITPAHRQRVLTYIATGQKEGARLLCGGEAPAEPTLARGNYLLPTVLGDVPPRSTIAQDEVFGPVLAVMTFDTEEQAVRLANDVIYGLGATVWTKDMKRALRLAQQLRAGNVSLNHPTINYLGTPFGGYKQSGLGREMGPQAIDSYTQWKNVVVDLADQPFKWFGG